MKFENVDQLKNHKKKFCVNSDYANVDKLDSIYQTQKLAQKMSDTTHMIDKALLRNPISKPTQPAEHRRDLGAKPGLTLAGTQTLQDMKLKIQNDEYNLLKLKDNQRHLAQLTPGGATDEDNFIQELIYMKNDLEINFRNDQQRIRQSVSRIEELNMRGENQLNLVARLQRLNVLLREREELRNNEFALIRDVEELQARRHEYLQRAQIAGEKPRAFGNDENTIHLLQSRKLFLVRERQRILEELEKLEKQVAENADIRLVPTRANYSAQQRQQPPQQYSYPEPQNQPQTVMRLDNPPMEVHVHAQDGTTQIYTGDRAKHILQQQQQQ